MAASPRSSASRVSIPLLIAVLLFGVSRYSLLAAEAPGRNGRALLKVSLAAIAIAALTTWVFPYQYYFTGPETPLALVPVGVTRPLPPSSVPFVVLGVRNVLFAIVLVAVAMQLRTATVVSARTHT